MRSLALRQWTLEFLGANKTNPCLLLRRNDLPRGSIESYPILNIRIRNPDTGLVEITTSEVGQRETYTTESVEDWPPLDPDVFAHFGMNPLWLPEDHEYRTWVPNGSQCVTHIDKSKMMLGQSCEQVIPPAKQKQVFSVLLPAVSDYVTDWINKHGLVDDVISICAVTGGYNVFYRAEQAVE